MTHQPDSALDAGATIIADALADAEPRVHVEAFFDEQTFTASYLVYDAQDRIGAIIDSVLDFDQASGRTSTANADAIIEFVRSHDLKIDWMLETHAHADHLSAAPYLKEELGGAIGIGAEIRAVQSVFGEVFNEGENFARDGSQFDHLFEDGEAFSIGGLQAVALHVPGHTPADLAYVIGDAVFVGDTMFMPDYGTARADFPGGDAAELFRSIQRLLRLPDATRIFLCHDYKAPGRDEYAWETSVAAQKANNIHVRDGVSESEFVALRTARDKSLDMPALMLPSVQINMRAGHFPEPEDNGNRYLKLPLNLL
jgi:glyoxylase-like metal-dependent hydrolase (beta-lactamase superfamily II)